MVCFELEIEHQGKIRLEQDAKKRFSIFYGLSRSEAMSYEAAAKELGACIMHALACNGQLKNDGP